MADGPWRRVGSGGGGGGGGDCLSCRCARCARGTRGTSGGGHRISDAGTGRGERSVSIAIGEVRWDIG